MFRFLSLAVAGRAEPPRRLPDGITRHASNPAGETPGQTVPDRTDWGFLLQQGRRPRTPVEKIVKPARNQGPHQSEAKFHICDASSIFRPARSGEIHPQGTGKIQENLDSTLCMPCR
ncbi:hypothetical protein [Gemmobacter nectariphilus]|uniref:hypothetical protein n=1 Tax=Gemmobacter nectariphilus TaxID=220343 RepID=UPI0012B5312A|nr:hypothetical protein [Gemmobacter nectariphilus]